MDKKKQLILNLEIVWWIVTAIVAYIVVNPILTNLSEFKFLWINILFIVILITYTRHIFLLKHTFLAYASNTFRIAMVFVSIPLCFFLTQMIWEFQTYLDNGGHGTVFNALKKPLSTTQKDNLLNYIYTEMFFFGVGSVVAGLILPFRMVLSVWRKNHKGTI